MKEEGGGRGRVSDGRKRLFVIVKGLPVGTPFRCVQGCRARPAYPALQQRLATEHPRARGLLLAATFFFIF